MRDAKQQSAEIATTFCKLTNKLMSAKNNDTLKLVDELEDSRRQKEAATRALNSAQEANLELEAELQQYKLLFGVIGAQH